MTSHSPERRAAAVAPPRLTEEEIDQLLSMTLIANLATIDRAGTIHVVPIWYRHEPPHILMPTSRLTQKYRNLQRNPRASVMVDLSRAGLDLRGVLVRGSVRIVEGAEAKRLNRSIHLRYVTAEGLRQPEVSRYLSEGDDVTLMLSMDKLVSWNNSASPSGQVLLQSRNHQPLDV
jgi:nitroimidazol reductase NimA-like FMN-containing flavoprotein (pyridoxamine 5'-phosphate oxidase superfamily)